MSLHRLFFFLFTFSSEAFALYNGNPSFPMMPEQSLFFSREEWFGVKAGYQCDRVYDRRLRVVHRHSADQRKRVQQYDSLSNQGVLTFNFNDRVELFGSAGVMSFDLTQRVFEEIKVTYDSETHLAWGIGGRAILAYWGDLQIGLNAAYLQSNPPLSSVKMNGTSSKNHATGKFREWQVGAGVSYWFHWFIPYLGVDFSDFRMKIKPLNSLKYLFRSNRAVLKEVYPLGIFFGFGLSPDKVLNINFEARLINENAASGSLDFKF